MKIPSPYEYRKHITVLFVCAILSGCATISNLQTALGTSVSPTQAILAANAYDAIEAGATGFLTFCKSNAANSSCSAANRRSVISYTRAGRAARNQMEGYIQSSTSIPAAIYNSVVAAVNNLKTTPAANYTGAQ
jgi:hypothetical protein